jgi:hypothetical protein
MEILLQQVESIAVNQSLAGRLLDYSAVVDGRHRAQAGHIFQKVPAILNPVDTLNSNWIVDEIN